MKKTSTLLLLSLLLSSTVFAAPVDPDKALEIANSFWKNVTGAKKTALRRSTSDVISKSANRNGASGSDAQYYLFASEGDGGFVIVSGEDCLAPIVGYSTENSAAEMPPALIDWLTCYSSYVDDVRAGLVEPVKATAAAGKRIAPMLKTSWNQLSPYNNLCPEVGGQKTPTGCTATAMAQVMKFHEWPERPKKAITWENNITGQTENIDITKNVYQWSKMLNHYRNGYTTEQADAVARLMVDVGKAIKSSYAPSGTGSNGNYAARALVNVFDYSPQIEVVNRNECTYDEFISLIRKNLEARQPLVHCGYGQSYAVGHAFVCDGIDENNLVHIDWGWDGVYNGYFDIGSMAPGGAGTGGGQDRYNVGQLIIANIKPRATGEANNPGDPTIFMYEIVDPKDDSIVDEYTSRYSSGYANFSTIVQFLNWSHSAVSMNYGISVKDSKGNIKRIGLIDEVIKIPVDDALGYYFDFVINNTSPANKNYLEEGTYYVEIYYKNANDEEPVKMRGENNCLILEVGKESATLRKALPDVELSDFEFRTAPYYRNDKMSFDVAFRNNNTNNATVVVVPIINRVSNNKVVHSDTLVSKGEIINVYDNTDVYATYTLNNAFSGSGEHYVSFAYDLRNSYVNLDLTVDKSRLKSIAGKSKVFSVQALPDGPLPTVTSISANNPVFGNALNIMVRILNNSEAAAFVGTIGLFAEKDGKRTLLTKGSTDGLDAGATAVLQYNSTDYIFSLEVGTYNLYACEFVNGEWVKIAHDDSYYLTFKMPAKPLLYTNSKVNINNGKTVIQGDSIDVFADITCEYGNLDGYMRMNVLDGLKMVLRSAYIPVSMSDGETININLRSMCGATAPLGRWEVNIVYYDNNKRQLGTVAVNNVNFMDNGVFYVHDETAIDDVTDASVSVVADEGYISVVGAVKARVLCADGSCVYNGGSATLNVESGVYVVVTEDAAGNVAVKKVLVK